MTLQDLNERPLSYSSLKQFAISPKHFINYRNRPKESTPALIYGQALHCMLLEPQEFNNQFIVSPKFDLRTTIGKEGYAKFQEQAEGKTILDEKLHTELFNLVDYIRTSPEWDVLLDGAETEVEERVELFGLPFITIKDIVKANWVVDVKSVQSGSLENLIRDFYNNQYHLQSAIYTQKGESFSFYIVEKNEPYYHQLISASDDFVKYGKKELERLCTAFNYCLEYPGLFNESYNFWHDYQGIKPIISLPYWVKNND